MSGFGALLTGHTLVNRYKIGPVIGRGGFAVVYEAHDERLDRSVAVKVITSSGPEGALEEDMRRRFEREARASAGLQHRNVVGVFDFGTDARLGLDFLVMERLLGEDLRTRLRREATIPPGEAMEIILGAAAGVAAGHRAGIIHRDVKPANIFLAEESEGPRYRVCVLDFGIALLAAAEDTTRLTRNGIPLSVPYASPEQLSGSLELTPASDVFSLGAVAYELLSGRRPYSGNSSEALDERAAFLPSVRELNPSISAALAAVISKALSANPEDRFADAQAFRSGLESAAAAPALADRSEPGTEAIGVSPAAASIAPAVVEMPAEDETLAEEPAPAATAASGPPPTAPRDRGTTAAKRRDTTRTGLVAAGVIGVTLLAGSLFMRDDAEDGPAGEMVQVSEARAPLDSGAPAVQGPATGGEESEAPPAGESASAAAPVVAQTPPSSRATAPISRPVADVAPTPARATPPVTRTDLPVPNGAEFRENLTHRCQSLPASEATPCLQADMATADRELNSVYQQVLSRMSAERRAALRESQRAWLARYDQVITSYYSTDWGNHSLIQVLPSQIQALRDRTAYLRGLE